VAQGHQADQHSRPPIAWDLLLPVLLSLLGGATYAFLRARYVSFYSDFGTSPDDVGLGYIQVLAGSVWAIALTFSFGLAAVLCVGWRLRNPKRQWEVWQSEMKHYLQEQEQLEADRKQLEEEEKSQGLVVPVGETDTLKRLEQRRQELDQKEAQLGRRLNRLYASDPGRIPRLLAVLLGVSTFCFLVTISWMTWTVPHDLDKAKDSITAGREVGPRDLAVLAIQADRARVTWIGTGKPPAELASSDLLFLGHSDGVAALYNSSMKRAVRVPERHVVVVISP
jgi:hypothetical protein